MYYLPIGKFTQTGRFGLGVENEVANRAERERRACLARSNFQARTGRGKFPFLSCSADHTRDGHLCPVCAPPVEECDHTHANVSSEVFVTAEEPRSDLLYYRDIRYKKLSRIVSTTEGPDFEGMRNITLNTYLGDR